ncbi:MAG TPA: reverse gyrase, partial [Candidatus Bathyarchaeota archaeon]|nr:reverse gyrase [Candidatus Bathyarchaeota archaeon]
MIPVIYENLCSVCGRDLTHEEIEREVCSTRNLHLSYSPYNVQDREFEELFRKVVGEPRDLQRFWMRRLVRRESFAAVAPTGIGKTTFGIVSALFFALNGKKSYILVPTTLLV